MSCVWRQPYARYNSAGSLQVTDITHTQTDPLTHRYTHWWSVGHFEIKAFITSDCPFMGGNRNWPRYQCTPVSQLFLLLCALESMSLSCRSKNVSTIVGGCTQWETWCRNWNKAGSCIKLTIKIINDSEFRSIFSRCSQVVSRLPAIHTWMHLLCLMGHCRWVVGNGDGGILSDAFWVWQNGLGGIVSKF